MMVHPPFGFLAVAAIVLAIWPLNSATSQPPASIAHASSPARGGPLVAGPSQPCVLLQNDNVLFGRARQVGEFVVVRTGQGGQVQLSRKEVACWADSTRDLYRYRVDHRRKGDLAAHVRDARWCLRYDLYDLAAQEIRVIRTYDPENIEAKRIEGELRRLTSPRAPQHAVSLARSSSATSLGHEDSGHDLGSVDLATLRGFASHIQPMLLNRCARCHSGNSAQVSQWNLVTPSAGARASSRMTRENLAASLRYIDRNVPQQSELLVKATTPHGGTDAPLDPRSAKAIALFKRWIVMASHPVATPSSVQHNEAGPGVAALPEIERAVFAERPVVNPTGLPSTSSDRTPSRLPEVTNPFDPDLFNRRFHSE
jgi:hypothetical protein